MSKHNREPRRQLNYDGKTLWDTREAGDTPLFDSPDRMAVPPELKQYTNKKTLRIVRQFMHPCPITGNLVPCRELEDGFYCWESPGKGWIFSNKLDGHKSSVSIETVYCPGVDFRLSKRALDFLYHAHKEEGADILVMTPEVVQGWVKKGALIERDGVYYFQDEIRIR